VPASADEAAFGHLLRRHRTCAGLTQERLAELSGLGERTIRDLESGAVRSPQRATTTRLVSALRLSTDEERRFRDAALPAPRDRRGRRPGAPGTLPLSPATRLFGRDDDIARLADLVPRSRLVTLTGPPGVGKTRLTLEVASRLAARYADGAAFVDLAAVSEARLMGEAISRALELRETAQRSWSDQLVSALRGHRLLLVLDGLEHLLAETGLIGELVAGCPGVTVLATSTASLRLSVERIYVVEPLALPAAVAMFVERARAIDGRFALAPSDAETIVAICSRLDGLPLAVELAAAQTPALPPRALLGLLSRPLDVLRGGPVDVPERQRTLRTAIAWSYRLLRPGERRVFRRLSAFAGGATLEAVADVCGAGGQVVETIAQLVRRSLVGVVEKGGQPRVRVLAALRAFGAEELARRGEEAEVRAAHAAWYARMATAPRAPGRSGQAVRFQRLEAEHDNLQEALGWATGHGPQALAADCVLALVPFWIARGHVTIGRHWLRRCLDLAEASGTSSTRLRVAAARLATEQNDYASASSLSEAALAEADAAGSPRGMAWARCGLGIVACARGDQAAALALLEEAAAAARDLRDDGLLAAALHGLGEAHRQGGDLTSAAASFQEELGVHRRRGDEHGVAAALGHLSAIAHDQADVPRLVALSAEALAICEALGDEHGAASALALGALGAHLQGQTARATELLEDCLARSRRAGAIEGRAQALQYLGYVAMVTGNLDAAVDRLETALALFGEIGRPRNVVLLQITLAYASYLLGDHRRSVDLLSQALDVTIAQDMRLRTSLALSALALVLASHDAACQAVRTAGAAQALRDALGARLTADLEGVVSGSLRGLRGALGDAEFERQWRAGTALSPADAARQALDALANGGDSVATGRELSQRGTAGARSCRS
jgi:predicted ATPase/tetratricopeptide (TPR) repeat protein/DNA-binding XRE family transcriptional regulator